ncbi:MAG: flagellar biosynthesis protein [Rhodobacteraceae bacterium]|nr:flagellar biosynthesis protein [Paracoccaceae bacterium]
MGRVLVLEDFGAGIVSDGAVVASASVQEEQKLAAFEQGYKAGWDDANKAHTEESSALSADLEANLRDLSFTFHEAKSHVLKGVEPLLRELVASVLPESAKVALPAMVGEALQPLLEGAAAAPVLVMCAPQTRPLLDGFIPSDPGFPLELRDDPTLADGQVFLRFGEREKIVDLASAINDVETMVGDFFKLNERKKANG